MQKSLLVLAVLGTFAGAASAQSSVTLFGVVDLNVSNFKAGNRIAGGTQVTKLVDGTINGGSGSRWGLRASEDLGGGMTAAVHLESGFAPDTGTLNQGGRLFGRQAFVSLASTNIGELRLGRQYTLHDETQVLGNPFSSTTLLNPSGPIFTNAAGTRLLQLFIDAPRLDNVLQYRSPNMGGFTAQFALAPGENVNDDYRGLRGEYLAGPASAAVSYEWNKDRLTGNKSNKLVEVAGGYDFGAFKLMGAYQHSMDLTNNAGSVSTISNWTMPATDVPGFVATAHKAYTVGASMPFGQLLAGVNFTRAKFEGAAGQSRSLGKFAIGAKYALSKNTFVYTALQLANGDMKESILEKRVMNFGINKRF